MSWKLTDAELEDVCTWELDREFVLPSRDDRLLVDAGGKKAIRAVINYLGRYRSGLDTSAQIAYFEKWLKE